MQVVFMIIQVIASLILIASILLQSGKSAGLSELFQGCRTALGKAKGGI